MKRKMQLQPMPRPVRPGMMLMTRNGKLVEVLGVDYNAGKGLHCRFVGGIDTHWRIDGKFWFLGMHDKWDLFAAPAAPAC